MSEFLCECGRVQIFLWVAGLSAWNISTSTGTVTKKGGRGGLFASNFLRTGCTSKSKSIPSHYLQLHKFYTRRFRIISMLYCICRLSWSHLDV